jgi:RHS repeat-associated protein
MTYKTGAGNMAYNSANQLTSRDIVSGVTVNYSYDANGNMAQGDGRTYQWNSFNKARTVTAGDLTVNFDYDANHKRVVKKSELETVYYVNPSYEKVIKHLPDGATRVIHRHNIWNGDDVVATFEKTEEGADEQEMGDGVKYYHRDHLGNGELVTGADMNVTSQRFYTPYGELVEEALQREQNASSQVAMLLAYNSDDYMRELQENNDTITSETLILSQVMYGDHLSNDDHRGFTSHEHIKELGLVNMNARLYDPVIGRFVSADSVIPDASDPLAYNRYIYVKNNPMMYRDPTGHWWQAVAFFVGAHLTDNQALQQLSTAVLAATLGGADGVFGFTGEATFGKVAFTAAKTTATITYLQTGNLKATVKAAAFSALSAGVTHHIGHGLDLKGITDNWVGKATLHGLAQGVINDLRGDKFAAGFVSGLASHASGKLSDGLDDGASTAIAMVSGYIGAEAAGGDGFQGALNAAVVHLYNALGGDDERVTDSEELRVGKVRFVPSPPISVQEEYISGGSNGMYETLASLVGSGWLKLVSGLAGRALDYNEISRVTVTYEAVQKQVYTFAPKFKNGKLIQSSYWKNVGAPIKGRRLRVGIPARYNVHSFENKESFP